MESHAFLVLQEGAESPAHKRFWKGHIADSDSTQNLKVSPLE
jgi:hypothetical protein